MKFLVDGPQSNDVKKTCQAGGADGAAILTRFICATKGIPGIPWRVQDPDPPGCGAELCAFER